MYVYIPYTSKDVYVCVYITHRQKVYTTMILNVLFCLVGIDTDG